MTSTRPVHRRSNGQFDHVQSPSGLPVLGRPSLTDPCSPPMHVAKRMNAELSFGNAPRKSPILATMWSVMLRARHVSPQGATQERAATARHAARLRARLRSLVAGATHAQRASAGRSRRRRCPVCEPGAELQTWRVHVCHHLLHHRILPPEQTGRAGACAASSTAQTGEFSARRR
jgi:hypothetical protein